MLTAKSDVLATTGLSEVRDRLSPLWCGTWVACRGACIVARRKCFVSLCAFPLCHAVVVVESFHASWEATEDALLESAVRSLGREPGGPAEFARIASVSCLVYITPKGGGCGGNGLRTVHYSLTDFIWCWALALAY
jgi:hypothetical protein